MRAAALETTQDPAHFLVRGFPAEYRWAWLSGVVVGAFYAWLLYRVAQKYGLVP